MCQPKAYDKDGKLTLEYVRHRMKTATSVDELCYWWQIGINLL